MQQTMQHSNAHRWQRIASAACIMLFFVAGANAAFATTTVDVRIVADGETIYDDAVYIDNCIITADGATYELDGPLSACALDQAATWGGFEYAFTDSSFGPYLTTVGEYTADDTNFWLFYVNDTSAAVGLTEYEHEEGDELLITYGSWPNTPLRLTVDTMQMLVGQTLTATVEYFDEYVSADYTPLAGATVLFGDAEVTTDQNGQVTFTPEKKGKVDVHASAEGYTQTATETVRVFTDTAKRKVLKKKARTASVVTGVDYLKTQLDDNGTIDGNIGMSEWAAMAFVAAKKSNTELFSAVKSYRPQVADGTSEIARHILAMEAMGHNSRKFRKADFVQRLKDTRANGQYGSEDFCNDDIFAGLALRAAGDAPKSEAVYDAVMGALNCVKEDGSVSYSVSSQDGDVDTTASFLWLMGSLKGKDTGIDLKSYRVAAYEWLVDSQNLDGGWGYTQEGESNASSTAWALQAFTALGHEAKATTTNNRDGLNYLESLQRSTGAFMYDADETFSSETLNTAYAVVALQLQAVPVESSRLLTAKKRQRR